MKKNPILLFGAGKKGQRALQYFGYEQVRYFADNDPAKVGYHVMEKPILSFEEMVALQEKYRIVLAVGEKLQPEIIRQFEDNKIAEYELYEDIYDKRTQVSNPYLQELKDRFAGRRCFVIGNGPSLRVEDLDKIVKNGDVSFASNKIFMMFDKTSWRPDVYCAVDDLILNNWTEEILQLACEIKLVYPIQKLWNGGNNAALLKESNVRLIQMNNMRAKGGELPDFSLDASKCVFDSGTVTYVMIQWAVYMGCREIILLGVDHSFDTDGAPGEVKTYAEDDENEEGRDGMYFTKGYRKKGETYHPPESGAMTKAYLKAEQVSRQNGFHVRNATRGGKLEVFERVDFDSLF